ncbi:SDR family NAD(P)-dependent oxidoreductase [Vibrio mangrovi]|uniref:3-oxoacyl-[acyl-carrier-protein] reductase FabG n=1 Tax=Vibrio mangrovi TaxID=474394 RepID=A0A1Y6IN64_9VIBR|nr:SDR family NAD(P)-dependent oxidoreductase [Vibrio mangrovi]MDW6004097.1 SDR family NAD(P)-dependent oxidoreductase [Vibrio mangrovi]SMR99105.1 3-oxoacyl-[acyl-carrier-protein] reductase FabG [Vibrio mangrovi]
MAKKSIALITGANKGIGLQIAKELAAKDIIVLIGARDLSRGTAAAASIGANAWAVQLDVTDPTSVAKAAEYIRERFGHLDILVNNAGISHAGQAGRSMEELVQSGFLSHVSYDEMQRLFATNVFGVVTVTQAMLPLLREAPAGRIVNMSSMNGSLTLNADPSNPFRQFAGIYAATKTALNAVTLSFAIELESTHIKVNAVCPGFTATEMNNFSGTGSVEEAAREPVRLALLDENGPTGTFSNANGPLPW